jgi:hypothetical protein
VTAVQLNTRIEKNIYHLPWKKIWSLLNGTSLQQGAVKRLVAKTSLEKVYNNQIQTYHELFNYCSSNIHNITFFYVQEEQILNYKKEVAD